MTIETIVIPDLGDVGDVDIIEVPIKEGDRLAVDDTLLVLESEKATMDVPSPKAGIVAKVLVKAGQRIREGAPVVELTLASVAKPAAEPAAESTVENTVESTVENTVENTVESAVENTVENTDVGSEPDARTTSEEPATAAQPDAGMENRAASEQALCLPDIGAVDQVEIIELTVSVGDDLEAEQTLMVLESDKATMDVPASMAGKLLELSVKVGDRVSSGMRIGTILASTAGLTREVELSRADAVAAELEHRVASSSKPPVPERPAINKNPQRGTVHASPGVRRFARNLGVDLSRVCGSGPKARVLRDDVQQFIKDELSQPKITALSGSMTVAELPVIDYAKFGPVEQVPLSRIQKVSSVNLHRNWVTIPHVTQFDSADITELEAFRKSLKDEAALKGVRLTPLAFMLKAAVASLQAFPTFNASLAADGESLVLKKYYHIGVAVDTPNGLVVPVLRDVDQKSIYELALELGEVSTQARNGKLSITAMQGGCFSISSLGGIGGTAFTPIVNWPDVAILGISRSRMEPVWKGTEFVPRLMLPLSLSYDHRVVDGALAARFITHYSRVLADIRRILL